MPRPTPLSRPLPIAVPLLLLLLLLPGTRLAAQDAPPPPPERLEGVGAAYETRKSQLFGLRTITVAGVSREVTFTLEPAAAGDSVRAVAVIPVSSFDSENDKRDDHVAEILGGADLAPLRFDSDPISVETAESILAGQVVDLAGTLTIAGVPKPIRFTLAVVHEESEDGGNLLRGWADTTFGELGVEVPSAGPGGVFGDPEDELQLWLQVPVPELPGSVLAPANGTPASSNQDPAMRRYDVPPPAIRNDPGSPIRGDQGVSQSR